MAKWLTIVLLILTCLPVSAQHKWTINDTQAYFKKLSNDKQKQYFKEIITEIQSNLPIQVDEVTQWVGLFYLPSTNTITRVITADITYNSLDQQTLDAFNQETKRHNTNSICTKIMFKMFMFETDTVMRAEFDYASGQRLFSWSMDKSNC